MLAAAVIVLMLLCAAALLLIWRLYIEAPSANEVSMTVMAVHGLPAAMQSQQAARRH